MHAAATTEVARSRRGLPKNRCGYRTRSGKPCKRPAGWGTDHPGYGQCKNHLGTTRQGRRAAEREIAASFMGAAAPLLDVDPSEALLYCVRRASTMASWFRLKVEDVPENEYVDADGNELHLWGRLERESLVDLARFSKMALDAGVNERRVKVAEQVGALVAQAAEDALADIDLSPADRTKFVKAFSSRLRVLEATQDPESLEGAIA